MNGPLDQEPDLASGRPPQRCPYCNEAVPLRPIGPRLVRCPACEYISPLPRQAPSRPEVPPLDWLAEIAPGCILRERYRLIHVLGRGAHGLTCFAEHLFLNHPCVVKILPHRIADPSDSAVLRLRQEARAGFRVNDPHVVRVLDCDALAGVWYFVMEYVEGTDLGALTAAGIRVGWQQALKIAIEVASGLAAIHQAGLLHRDIKPQNLLLGTDTRVRVTDLGVVGLASATGSAMHDQRAGTLDYAAPEVFELGASVGVSADLYSLGATLYHLLTGQPPHGQQSVFTRLIGPQVREVAWPEDQAPDVPGWFRQTILKLLAPDPAARFESAQSLCEHLRYPLRREAAIPAPTAAGLEPAGLTVLPFEPEPSGSGDEWLGFALADGLARELARCPGVYVADHQQLRAVLSRHERPGSQWEPSVLLRAGRLVGAAAVIGGSYLRQGDSVAVRIRLYRQGCPEPVSAGPFESPLRELVRLQGRVFEAVANLLGIPAPARPAIRADLGPQELAAREKLTRGRRAYLRGDYEVAIRLFREAQDLDAEVIEAAQYLCTCYARLGRYAEAELCHQQIISVAQQRNDQQLLAEAKASAAFLRYLRGEYAAAHTLYLEAAELAEQMGLETECAQIYNNAGFALLHLGRSEQAEAAFRKAIAICRRFGALAALIGPYNGLGNVLLAQKRYEEARDHYLRALTLAEETGDRTNVGICHMHLGRCASLQGNFSQAKNEFALALNTLEETPFWNARARTYEYIAEMNLRLGHYAEALRCADKKIELARRHANSTMEAEGWRLRADVLRRMGRETEAESCLEKARQMAALERAAGS